MPSEQVGEAVLLPVRVEEAVVARLAAVGKLAPQGGDPLDVPPQLDLLGEELGSRRAIVCRFVREWLAALRPVRRRGVGRSYVLPVPISRRSSSVSLGSLVANVPVFTSPAGSYVATITPVSDTK